MKDSVIRVEGLGKRYRVAARRGRGTLASDLVQALTDPIQRLRSRTAAAPTDQFWALRDVSFDVPRGEVLGIVGSNGAGKSTLLKLLSRVTRPTTGRATLDGHVASLLEVGAGFHPELTGRENVYLNGCLLGLSRAQVSRRLDDIVQFAEVEQFLDMPVKRYSSGMYVRLAFAVAAHLDAEILLVDEVLSVGDVGYQKKSVRRMRELTSGGRTVLFVSHNLTLVRSMSDRVVWLDHGVVRKIGDPDDVVAEYLSGRQAGPLSREITDADHAYGVVKARVRRVSITDLEGHLLSTLRYRQPYRVRVELDILAPVEAGTFSLSVLTEEGVRVLMTHTLDTTRDYIELRPGPHVVDIQMENRLNPGAYVLEFGGHHLPSTMPLCHVPTALAFDVSSVAFTPGEEFSYHNRSGLIDVQADWDVRECEENPIPGRDAVLDVRA